MSDTVNWDRFKREVPRWYTEAKLGIFVHWGLYSVPAWAEINVGEAGTIEKAQMFTHNPYAEWYGNTSRVEGSPAREHHKKVHGDAPYIDFLDQWKAENFNPDQWAELFAHSGAQYVIPTAKHHEGVTLWPAPGIGNLNTVDRGPKRDLIGDIASAVRKKGLHFGVYYSGGIDWSISYAIPHSYEHAPGWRPLDAAYSMYCYQHVVDLIDRYKPEVIFNDINWPDFAKREGDYSLPALFDYYYSQVPTGVVNDRFGVPHSDYKTSEYKFNLHHESEGVWENNRGIGFSFGYNQLETEEQYLNITGLLHHFVDIVSRGGNLLLNVGPKASGEIPELQQKVLRQLGDWMKKNSKAIYASKSVLEFTPSDLPWVRWTGVNHEVFAHIDSTGITTFEVPEELVDDSTAHYLSGERAIFTRNGNTITIDIDENHSPMAVISFRRR